MKYFNYVVKPALAHRRDKFWMFVAWCLPLSLVAWCVVRVAANATTGLYSSQVVPELTVVDALKRWTRK